jgi:hypothetical protein
MTGGGLLVLVSYGSQNVILSGNPQMTYYFKIFKRYSHFAMENVTIAMDGPNTITDTGPIQLRAKIQRIGDLLSDMVFSFNIPDIYSKAVSAANGAGIRQFEYEFQWVKALGAAIINSAEFFIGGQSIQRFDGTYLYAKAQLEYDTATLAKWNILVGNTNELTAPAAGAYAASANSGPVYPTVVSQGPGITPTNRPSIFGQTIHVPLNFWFTDATSQALPLVALQNQECEVVLTLNPVQTLYTILDPNGVRVAPQFQTISNNLNNPVYGATTERTGDDVALTTIQNFLADIGVTAPLTWPNLNPVIQCTFVYLSDEERTTFATRPLTYVLPQLRILELGPINKTSDTYKLDVSNPITRCIFIPSRTDNYNRNDFTNYTNWSTYPFAPLNSGSLTGYNLSHASGVLIPNSQRDIIQSVRFLCNGNEIQQEKPFDFLTKIYPFRYTTGNTNAEIPIYTWALTSSKIQPSGSLNASRITNLQLEAKYYALPTDTNYVYDLTLYVETLNFLIIASGSGAPKYVL